MKRRSFFGAIAGLFGLVAAEKLTEQSDGPPMLTGPKTWNYSREPDNVFGLDGRTQLDFRDGFEYLKSADRNHLSISSVNITTEDGTILIFDAPSIIHFNVHEGEVRGIVSVSNVKPSSEMLQRMEQDIIDSFPDVKSLSGRSGGETIRGETEKGKMLVLPSRQCGKTAFMKDQNV